MVDEYNPSLGTVAASSNGPTTTGVYTSASSNEFATVAGFFRQDYYFDTSCPALGEDYLDSYNGHDHDNLGYHYHLTITETSTDPQLPVGFDTGYEPVFPYTFGPRYRGELNSNAMASCAPDGNSQMMPPRP